MKNSSSVLGWAALVLVASFLPWGTFQATISSLSGGLFGNSAPFGNSSPFGGFNPFGAMSVPVTVSGWNGNLTLAGIALPNWLAVVAALAAAAIGYARTSGLDSFPRFLPAGLTVYALLHVVLLAMIIASQKGTLGIGTLLMIAALIGILTSLFKASNAAQNTPSSR